MEYYVIKKRNKNKKLGKFNFDEKGYVFKPNIKSNGLIEITSLSITNPEITNSILKKKCDKSFRKLASMILKVLKDEDTSTGKCNDCFKRIRKRKNCATT